MLELSLWTFDPVESLLAIVAELGFRGRVALGEFTEERAFGRCSSPRALLRGSQPFVTATTSSGIGPGETRSRVQIKTSVFDARYPRVCWTAPEPRGRHAEKLMACAQVSAVFAHRIHRSPSRLYLYIDAAPKGSTPPDATMRWIVEQLPTLVDSASGEIFGAAVLGGGYYAVSSLPPFHGIQRDRLPAEDRTFDRVLQMMLLPNRLARVVKPAPSEWVETRGSTHSTFVARHPVPHGDPPPGWGAILIPPRTPEQDADENEGLGRIIVNLPNDQGVLEIDFDSGRDHSLYEQVMQIREMLRAEQVELLTEYGLRAAGLSANHVPRVRVRRADASGLRQAIARHLRGKESSPLADSHFQAAFAALRDLSINMTNEQIVRFKRIATRLAQRH